MTVNTTYHFELLSRDVVHSFCHSGVSPEAGCSARPHHHRLVSSRIASATYDIQCTQMCGIGHGMMAGRIIVETPQDHAAWLMRNSNPAVGGGQQSSPASARR